MLRDVLEAKLILVEVTAASGIATSLHKGVRTLHSMLKLRMGEKNSNTTRLSLSCKYLLASNEQSCCVTCSGSKPMRFLCIQRTYSSWWIIDWKTPIVLKHKCLYRSENWSLHLLVTMYSIFVWLTASTRTENPMGMSKRCSKAFWMSFFGKCNCACSAFSGSISYRARETGGWLRACHYFACIIVQYNFY